MLATITVVDSIVVTITLSQVSRGSWRNSDKQHGLLPADSAVQLPRQVGREPMPARRRTMKMELEVGSGGETHSSCFRKQRSLLGGGGSTRGGPWRTFKTLIIRERGERCFKEMDEDEQGQRTGWPNVDGRRQSHGGRCYGQMAEGLDCQA